MCIHDIQTNDFFYQILLQKQIGKADTKQNHGNRLPVIVDQITEVQFNLHPPALAGFHLRNEECLIASLAEHGVESVHRTRHHHTYTDIQQQNQSAAQDCSRCAQRNHTLDMVGARIKRVGRAWSFSHKIQSAHSLP